MQPLCCQHRSEFRVRNQLLWMSYLQRIVLGMLNITSPKRSPTAACGNMMQSESTVTAHMSSSSTIVINSVDYSEIKSFLLCSDFLSSVQTQIETLFLATKNCQYLPLRLSLVAWHKKKLWFELCRGWSSLLVTFICSARNPTVDLAVRNLKMNQPQANYAHCDTVEGYYLSAGLKACTAATWLLNPVDGKH